MPVPGDMYVFHRCLWLRSVEVKGMTCRSLSNSSDEGVPLSRLSFFLPGFFAALQHTFQILSPDKVILLLIRTAQDRQRSGFVK